MIENKYKFIISTDSTADLPDSYIADNELLVTPLTFILDGVEYLGEGKPTMDPVDFYALMRRAKMPKTSQVTVDAATKALTPYAEAGIPVLHIAFSSALSGTYNSFSIAAADLKETYPQSSITVIDSLCASLGEGMLVDKAVKLRNEGRTLDEAAGIIEGCKLQLCHFFTVDDLFHLQRGGRVSKITAVVGSLLGIKPILHVNDEGKLIPIDKVRGRKASLIAMADSAVNRMLPNQKEIFISHGDCLEDAQFVADEVKKRTGIDKFLINFVGPVIGTHSGPGTVAIFFFSENRSPRWK